MKKSWMLLGGVLFILFSCKKDKEEKPENFIEFNGMTIELSSGTLQYFGNWSGAANIDLNLFSSGITHSEIGFKGKGTLIYFELYSSNPLFLQNGIYDFDETASEDPGTFDLALFVIDEEIENISASDFTAIKGGTVTVDSQGSIYDITIDCTDNENNRIYGHFNGQLAVYDIPFL